MLHILLKSGLNKKINPFKLPGKKTPLNINITNNINGNDPV